jgi:hypothetical protein
MSFMRISRLRRVSGLNSQTWQIIFYSPIRNFFPIQDI